MYRRNNESCATETNEDLVEHMTSLEILKRAPKMNREEMILTQVFYKCKGDDCNAMGFTNLEGLCDKCYVTSVRAGKVKLPSKATEMSFTTKTFRSRDLNGRPNIEVHALNMKNPEPKPNMDLVDFDEQLPGRYRIGILRGRNCSQPSKTEAWESYLCSKPDCNNSKGQGTNEMCRDCFEGTKQVRVEENFGPVTRTTVAMATPTPEFEQKMQCSMPWCENPVGERNENLCAECFDVLSCHRQEKPVAKMWQIGGNRSGSLVASGSVDREQPTYTAQYRYHDNYPDELLRMDRSSKIPNPMSVYDKHSHMAINESCPRPIQPRGVFRESTGNNETALSESAASLEYPNGREVARRSLNYTEQVARARPPNTENPAWGSARQESPQRRINMETEINFSQSFPENGTRGSYRHFDFASGDRMENNDCSYTRINTEIERNANRSSAKCKEPLCSNFGNSRCHGYCNSCFKRVQ